MPAMRVTSADSRPPLLRLAATAALLALAAAAPIACGAPEPTAPRPDLLLVVVRGQGTALGCYGDAEVHTPRLDDVAARGALMERAYVAAAGSEASLASLLSGRIDADVAAAGKTWSERFQEVGYRTGVVGAMERGVLAKAGLDFAATARDESPIWSLRQVDRFVGDADTRPWCLVVVLDGVDAKALAADAEESTPQERWARALELADRASGAVLDLLVDRGAAGDLIGLHTADGGVPALPAAGALGEARVRVPVIAFGKTVQPGRHADFVSHLDVLPTLLELAGAGAKGLEGRSFARVLEGLPLGTESAPWTDQVITRLDPAAGGAAGTALRFDRWKYAMIGEEEFLHDLEQDAAEAVDLSEDPDAARALEEARARLRR